MDPSNGVVSNDTQWNRNFDRCIKAVTGEQRQPPWWEHCDEYLYWEWIWINLWCSQGKTMHTWGKACESAQQRPLLKVLLFRSVKLNEMHPLVTPSFIRCMNGRFKILSWLMCYVPLYLATLHGKQHPVRSRRLQSWPSWGKAVPRDDPVRVLL